MARNDALMRLQKSLQARRDELRRKLTEDLSGLRNTLRADSTGDAADVAFESGSDEMASQLAELDSRELTQIDRALARINQGTYGVCEGCGGKIPVGRLNALPFCTLCIDCQREMERYPGMRDPSSFGSWDRVFDTPAPLEDQREVDLSKLEIDLPSR
jgi:DnaK suppressor protein